MSYRISAIMCLVLSACAAVPEPGPLPPPQGDLRYLLTADPAAVTSTQLLARAVELQDRMERFHLANGIVFQGYYHSPDDVDPVVYGSGGDSLLFSGYYLASCVYRWRVTNDPADRQKVTDALRGLYILTHVTGKPGVLCRSAFPLARAAEWQYPAVWQHRIDNGFVHEVGPWPDPFNPGQQFEPMAYYTRATRDQLTGLLYGLAVYWKEMPSGPERLLAAQIVSDVYRHLEANDFKIVDEHGRNDTSADDVDALLMLQLLAVYRATVSHTGPIEEQVKVSRAFDEALDDLLDRGFYWSDLANRFNNVYYVFGIKVSSYYAWNLRFARVFSVYLLLDNEHDKYRLTRYLEDWIYCHVAEHKNAFFDATFEIMRGQDGRHRALLALKSQSLRPTRGWSSPVARGMPDEADSPSQLARFLGLADDDVLWPHLREPTTYWTWQQDPWRNGVSEPHGAEDNMGLDFLLPYWLGRYYGLF